MLHSFLIQTHGAIRYIVKYVAFEVYGPPSENQPCLHLVASQEMPILKYSVTKLDPSLVLCLHVC